MRYLPLVVACVFFLVLGGWLTLRFSRWLEIRRGRARNVRGQRGERDAERILIAHGYRIHSRQRRTSYPIEVDGTTQHIALILDFEVEKNGERLVAEVKTGNAASLSNVGTRRQVLEYQLATSSHRVLLVDPETATITQVAFPIAGHTPQTRSPWPTLVAIAALLALTWWLTARQ